MQNIFPPKRMYININLPAKTGETPRQLRISRSTVGRKNLSIFLTFGEREIPFTLLSAMITCSLLFSIHICPCVLVWTENGGHSLVDLAADIRPPSAFSTWDSTLAPAFNSSLCVLLTGLCSESLRVTVSPTSSPPNHIVILATRQCICRYGRVRRSDSNEDFGPRR